MIWALRNTLDSYSYLSKQYLYSSSFVNNKGNIPIRLLSIPSIFYRKEDKARFNFLQILSYPELLSGELRDYKKNRWNDSNPDQLGSTRFGINSSVFVYIQKVLSCLPVLGAFIQLIKIFLIYMIRQRMLARLGFIFWWQDQMQIILCHHLRMLLISNGTETIPTITMFAHLDKGEFNFSNNPTFLEYRSGDNSLF